MSDLQPKGSSLPIVHPTDHIPVWLIVCILHILVDTSFGHRRRRSCSKQDVRIAPVVGPAAPIDVGHWLRSHSALPGRADRLHLLHSQAQPSLGLVRADGVHAREQVQGAMELGVVQRSVDLENEWPTEAADGAAGHRDLGTGPGLELKEQTEHILL